MTYLSALSSTDPYQRRWMLFVDGENFTIRAQEVAKKRKVTLTEGPHYSRDTFIWFPKIASAEHSYIAITSWIPTQRMPPKHSPKSPATSTFIDLSNSPANVQHTAIRS